MQNAFAISVSAWVLNAVDLTANTIVGINFCAIFFFEVSCVLQKCAVKMKSSFYVENISFALSPAVFRQIKKMGMKIWNIEFESRQFADAFGMK